jgi:RNase P subunit RPR2
MAVKVKRAHTHTAVTIRALRQRSGIPYEVERSICADCRRVLAEKPLKRASAS